MKALAGDPAKPLISIQYLRAFAALAVVLFHACQWADINFDIGAGGVDVFFIISGFLMWRITDVPGAAPSAGLRYAGRLPPTGDSLASAGARSSDPGSAQ